MNLKRIARKLDDMRASTVSKKDIKSGLRKMGFVEITRGKWVPKEGD